MKRMILPALLMLMATLAGCSLFPQETVIVETKWIPNTSSNGMTHWLPGMVILAEVNPEPEVPITHSWHIVWGDGKSDQWNDGSYNQQKSDKTPVFNEDGYMTASATFIDIRDDNTAIGIGHYYRLPGTYQIEIWYDGALRCAGPFPVELQEKRPSFDYNEEGELVQINLLPWAPEELP